MLTHLEWIAVENVEIHKCDYFVMFDTRCDQCERHYIRAEFSLGFL